MGEDDVDGSAVSCGDGDRFSVTQITGEATQCGLRNRNERVSR
jgi:hypothetical protein